MAVQPKIEAVPGEEFLDEEQLDLPLAGAEVSENGDVEFTFGEEPAPIIIPEEVPHFANLAEHLASLPDGEELLKNIGEELTEAVKGDKESRQEWLDTYRRGIELLGFKLEEVTEPFEGAASATHPLLAEAVVDHQSRMIVELLPPGGPVKTRVVGDSTQALEQQAKRVKDYMNYQLTEEMVEYFDEHDMMLFQNGVNGSAFKKMYLDTALGRPRSVFVPAEDFVINYYATSLASCSRYTHIVRYDESELRKLQLNGFYRDVPLTPMYEYKEDDPESPREEMEKVIGISPSPDDDGRYVFYEIHTNYDLPFFEHSDELGAPTGLALPYVVTVDVESGIVMSIRRNWLPNDPRFMKLLWFAHYPFIRGPGFYGLGLLHLIGGLSKSATVTLRSLLDSGQFANLQGGFKTKGIRWTGATDEPIRPGEWRDVEAFGGEIKNSLYPLPYKEPSATLFQLLGYLVEAGQRFVDTSKRVVTESANYGPLGTTLALIEAAQKPANAIYRRMHNAQTDELRILARINAMNLPDEPYPYNVVGGQKTIMRADFDDRVDVFPASDPTLSTGAQRVAQARLITEIAREAPEEHNLREVILRAYNAINVPEPEKLLKPPPREAVPLDPVGEAMAMLNNMPVRAFPEQDHQSHIVTHVSFLEDPRYGADEEVMEKIGPRMKAHIAEHMAFRYRQEIEQLIGQPLPPPGQPVPPEVDAQISRAVAQAATQLSALGQRSDTEAEQAAAGADPYLALEQDESRRKWAELEVRREKGEKDRALKREMHEDNIEVKEDQVAIQRMRASRPSQSQ